VHAAAAIVTVHRGVGVAVLAVTAAAAAGGGLVLWKRRSAGPLVTQLLALAQTVLVAQVAIGLLLLSDERRSDDRLHYLYGFLSLAAVLAPWLYAPAEPRRRLAWFAVATLLAFLLAGRAYLTSL
jgi:hypothetical protein